MRVLQAKIGIHNKPSLKLFRERLGFTEVSEPGHECGFKTRALGLGMRLGNIAGVGVRLTIFYMYIS